ncbi:MAG: HAD family hydrolase [Candidatus Hodarchaeota archaeon]
MFFDHGQTLVSALSVEDMNREFIWPKLKELGTQGTYANFEHARSQVFAEKEQDYIIPPIKPRSETTPFLKLVIDKMGPTHLTIEQIRAISEEGWQYHRTITKSYPGTLEMLQWIRDRGLKLAVISNWYQEELEGYLDQLSLRHFFDLVMSSEKAGALKITLKPFQRALNELNVDPNKVIHVGDSINQDGACRHLGITFVYCTWYQEEYPDTPAPAVSADQYDFSVKSHAELIETLKTLI